MKLRPLKNACRALLVALTLVIGCSSASEDGGSSSDFQTCADGGSCREGICVEGVCRTDVEGTGDGATGSPPDDCRTLGCGAPFECVGGDGEAFLCSSEGAGVPECRGTPAESPLKLQATDDGIPVHYVLLEECLPVTYEPALEGEVDEIGAAIDEINGVACGRLCFELSGTSDEAPEARLAERRVHLQAVPTSQNGAYLLSTTFFEQSTGRIISCSIEAALDQLADVAAGDYMGALLLCSGFTTTPNTTSVTAPSGAPGVAPGTLPDDDVASICAVYGAPAYCASEDGRFQ